MRIVLRTCTGPAHPESSARTGLRAPSFRPGSVGIALVLMLAATAHRPASAQNPWPDSTDVPATRSDSARAGRAGPLGVTGTIGAAAEGYSASGITGRRPSASGNLFADLDVDLYGLRSGFRLLLSTDESGRRQSINRIGYSGRWRALGVDAGDVTPSYSPFSVQGTTVRGAGVELTPGPFLLSYLHGSTRRGTSPDSLPLLFLPPAYDRTLDAVRLGIGRRAGTHLHLIGVRVRDAEPAGFSADTTRRVPPKENLSFTPDVGLVLFGGGLRMQGTGTVSAITRDTRTTRISGLEGPAADALGDLFTPRVGSRVDYAAEATADVRVGRAAATASYERVQPGFESLGVGYLRSDRETVRLRPRVQLLRGRLSLDGNASRSRDNLRGDRLLEQTQTELGANAQTQLGRLSLGVGYLRFLNTSTPTDAAADSLAPGQRQALQSVTLTPAFALPGTRLTQLIAGSLSVQELSSESDDPATGAALPGFRSLNSTLTYVLALPSGLSVNLGGNYLRNDAQGAETAVSGASAGVSHRLLNGALTLNLTGGLSRTEIRLDPLGTQRSSQLRADASGAYRLGRGGTLRMTVHGTRSDAPTPGALDFRELRSELRYERSFGTR